MRTFFPEMLLQCQSCVFNIRYRSNRVIQDVPIISISPQLIKNFHVVIIQLCSHLPCKDNIHSLIQRELIIQRRYIACHVFIIRIQKIQSLQIRWIQYLFKRILYDFTSAKDIQCDIFIFNSLIT